MLINNSPMLATNLVDHSRHFFNIQTNNPNGITFICIVNDGWYSEDYNMLGVSIHFLVPKDW
jgi:hypothetical protein